VRSRIVLVVFVALVAGLLVASGSDRAAASESTVELPIGGISDLLLDEAHGHIYVSSGYHNDSVLVLDLNGNVVKTISGVDTASLMDLSPSGDILWVAAPGSDEVIGYSTDTFDEVDRVAFAAGDCPISVADLGGTLVVGGGCGQHEPIRIVDVATKTISDAGGRTVYAATVVHNEAWGDVVLVATLGVSPFTVYELDTGAATPETVQVMFGPGSNLRQLAPHPDGGRFVTASGSPYVHQEFYFGTYDASIQYVSTNYPNAAAWSGDGTILAAGTDSPYDDDIYTFMDGSPTAFWSWNLQDGNLEPRGLAINNDGSTVYAISNDFSTGTTVLHIVDVGTALPGKITGVIEHDFPTFNSGRADQGHVDLYVADTNEYLGTWDADGLGNYTIPSVDPGVYELVFWNGDDDTIVDFFPELYKEQPLFLDDKATPVTVDSGQTVTINGHLRPLFFDMFDSVFINDIYWMGNAGITKGCDPPDNTLYCPDDTVTRGAMAAFLARAFRLPASDGSIDFVDDNDSIFESDIEKLAFVGITKGCNPPTNDRFCPDDPVTRGQMAAFMVRSFGLVASGTTDFVDDNGSIFESAIEKLAYAGITKGCNPPTNDRFCPDDPVTRGQMAAFLKRGFEYVASLSQADATLAERFDIPLSD
jgi:hypothetical protein